MDSIMSRDRECWVCGSTVNLHKHHCYPGNGRRGVSEREGCWVWLCGPHHNLSNYGVHFDRDLDLRVRQECERAWIERNGSDIEGFRRVFGANYL